MNSIICRVLRCLPVRTMSNQLGKLPLRTETCILGMSLTLNSDLFHRDCI
jgi:hypothetical protein